MQSMMWLALVFAVGAMIGSFLNVCIYRLPLEKSILWPATSHCGQCFQSIRWYDNIPLVSYWLLRGRCRECGQHFSARYFFIELLTGLLLAGIFYLEVIANVHRLDAAILGPTRMLLSPLVFFAFHGVLACFLIVATFCDFDHQIIPLPLTLTGTVIGLVGAVIWAWPWPYTPAEIGVLVGRVPKSALYPWPVWWRLPAILQPGGNWQTGFATGGAGVLAGTLLLRAIRFLFGFGMGAQYMDPAPQIEQQPTWMFARWISWLQRVGGKALGLGDADLMMMAGAFMGWQTVLVAFFVAVFPGLFLALTQLLLRGNNVLPFGPALAMGVLATLLGWTWIGPYVYPLFFDGMLLSALGGMCGILMLFFGFLMRARRVVAR
jgi:leader peptidase (prepilin peptidase) / N-methyltransferase